ncbi:hypothetical protein A4X13_0g2713 [Tilletia indica]|uniref:Carboxylesterase type B domain-containing protein n=1 Tax=Tilletia indica TaxID=43049 RepID=A0A177TAK0_9BASI|nr:hypothetical protein A4X13_0g2713 [Tilletia indica]
MVIFKRNWTLGAVGTALLTCLAASASPSIRILPPTSLDWTQFRSNSPPPSYLLLTDSYSSQTQASDACARLNEQLVDVADAVQDSNLIRQLAYLVFEGLFPADTAQSTNRKKKEGGATRRDGVDQMIWASRSNLVVLSSNSDGTNAELNSESQSAFRSGMLNLPALCTNSAPWKTVNSTDTSSTWHVSVKAGSGDFTTTYTGFRDLLGFRFAAIPYAKPPTRFAHSVPLISPQSVQAELGANFNALRTTRGLQCPQTSGTTYPYTEDGCLLLNIATGWLPNPDSDVEQGTKGLLRPIIFWIHGGGFTSGSGLDGTFDGTGLSSRNDIVVITPNYRLGTLGWLAVSDDTSPGLTGNFGLGDIISALKWVRAHAATFGGDPDRVSVMGQSAGAQIVQLLLQSTEAKGLFQSAVVMSGRPWDQVDQRLTRTQAEKPSSQGGANGLAVLQSLGCAPSQNRRRAPSSRRSSDTVLDCLRRLPTSKFLTSSIFSKPVRDGFLVKDATLDLSPPSSAQGNVNRVPLLLGTMRDELGSLGSVPAVGTSLGDALSQAGIVDPQKSAVVQNKNGAFPPSRSGRDAVQNLTVTVETEINSIKRCGHDSGLNLINNNHVFPIVHAYEFFSRAWQIPNYDPNAACAPRTDDELQDGHYFLCHSGDLMTIFASPGFMFNLSPRDELDLSFIRSVSDAWAAFARSGGKSPVMGTVYASVRGYGSSRRSVSGWQSLGQSGGQVALLGAHGVEDVRTLGGGSVGARCSALGLGINYIRNERD